tara:strand:- start:110 stop:793 length:684 start_codon:yes stop_codon:yes gene_type:complete
MTAKIKLNAASGGGSISIQAPSSSSNNRVIALPDIADGTLVTSQSTLDATKLSGNLPALNGSALTNLSAGKILQVVQTQILTASSTTSQGFADTALIRTITPTSASSKILCMVDMKVSGSGESFIKLARYNGGTGYNIAYSTVNTTYTGNQGFAATYHTASYGNYYDMRSVTVHSLDTAINANEHSYRVQWRAQQGTIYLNRAYYSTSSLNYSGSGASSITLMEVAA